MAESLSNEISINLSSDNIPEHYCDPCYEIKDEIKPIAGHCIDCGESLCVECFNNHLGPKPSRNHKLVDTSAKPPIKQKRKAMEMKTGEKCSVHGSIIQSFCTSHSELCCNVCRTINHKTCELEEISEKARHLQNSQELQILNTKLKKIHKGFEDNLRKTGHHEMTIQKNFTNAINKIKKLRDEIDNLLRETEKLAKEVQEEDFRIIETVSSTCNIVIEQINSITSNLDIMNTKKENERLFIFMKRAESQLQSLQDSLLTLDNDNAVREYIFEPDEKIQAIMRDLKVLGHLNFTGPSKSQQISQTKVLEAPTSIQQQLKKNIVHFTDINTNSKSGKNVCMYGSVELSNNQIFTDHDNKKQNVDASVQLGPGVGMSRFADLDKTSFEGTIDTQYNSLIVASRQDEDSSGRYGVARTERSDPRGRGGFGRQPSFDARQSQENEREKAIAAAKLSNKLHDLIVVRKTDNAGVIIWIETNIDELKKKQTTFIRELMTAVCNSAIRGDKGKERVDPGVLTSRHKLLQKYLDYQPVSELHGLYALQALVTKLEHPQGVLRTIFDTLYAEDIISGAAFIQWEKSEDQPEGKDATLKQVVPFLTWLKEDEVESDS